MSDHETESAQATNARRLVYFAAERTLMSWVRTALGIMALGFVIDRFGLVLQQISTPGSLSPQTGPYSFWGGGILVLVGATMALLAAVRYWLFAYRFKHENSTRPGHGIFLGVSFSLVIAILGFLIAIYLLKVGIE